MKKILFMAIFLFLISFSTVSAQDMDGEDISYNEGIALADQAYDIGTFTDLKNLVEGTDDDGRIILDRDYRFNDTDGSALIQGIQIHNSITIDGNGHTIDGNHTARVFTVYGSLTLLNTIIINGLGENQDGGAIYNRGNTILNNCTFRENSAGKEGGAISTYVNLTIYNCTFDLNSADDRGGAIYCEEGTINIDNSNFTNNTAYNYAGAISVMNKATTTISNSNFIGNIAYNERGGAIRNNGGHLIVINSNFKDNEAQDFGGAVSSFNSSITVVNGSNFTGNTAGDRGGALYTEGILNITNSNFKNNKAAYGGAISNQDYAETIIRDSTFIANSADNRGGAIRNNGGYLEIINSTFINNTAEEYGGAVSSFNNSNTVVNGSNFTDNYAGDRGGALYTEGALNITNSNFKNNKAAYGGAISNQDYAETIVADSAFTGNKATNRGGAIRNNGGYLSIYNTVFENNTAAEYGGAVSSFNDSNTVVNNSNFTSNEAGDRGGALYTEGILNVSNSNFRDNNASYGGAISNQNDGESVIADSTFTGNSADSRGGAIRNNGGHLSIYNTTFENNTAKEYGGAVSSFADSLTVVSLSAFKGNTANNRGGAIHNEGNLNVTNTRFENNNATNYGGAISNYIESNATIINSTFDSNQAKSGGAVETNSKLNITDSTFSNNSAESGGAVTAIDNVVVDINNSTFNNNVGKNGLVFYFEGENANVKINNNNYTIAGENAPIFVNKTIINSDTEVMIMNNETRTVENGDNLNLTAVVMVDGQLVYGYDLEFLLNGADYPSNGLANGTYYAPINVDFKGDKLVNITNNGIKADLTDIKTAMLKVKEEIKLAISSKDIVYGNDELIELNLTDSNGNNINGTVTVTVDGKEYWVTLNNGIGLVNVTGLNVGTYVVKANFAGDEIYTSTTAETTFNVVKANTELNITVNNITYGQNATASIKANVDGNVTVNIDGKQYQVTIINGVGLFNVTGLDAGTYIAEAYFQGNENYNKATAETTFEVAKANTELDISVDNITYLQYATVTVKSSVDGTVTVKIDNKTYQITIENNVGSCRIGGLNSGTYSAEAHFQGNENYNSATAETAFNVAKLNVRLSIAVENITYGQNTVVTVKSTIDGIIMVFIDGRLFTVVIRSGIGTRNLSGLNVGIYTANAYFQGSRNFNPARANTTFIVTDNSTSADVHDDDDMPNSEQNGFSKAYETSNNLVNNNNQNNISTIKTGNPLALLFLALFGLIYPIKRRK